MFTNMTMLSRQAIETAMDEMLTVEEAVMYLEEQLGPRNLRDKIDRYSGGKTEKEILRGLKAFINGDVPRIIVCLDELSTVCVYQAVIDYNVVGEVNILGYYDSDTIINAINRGAVYCTVSVDTAQLGEYCVSALEEYNDFGATSQYFTADVTLINRSNVSSYIRKEEQNE